MDLNSTTLTRFDARNAAAEFEAPARPNFTIWCCATLVGIAHREVLPLRPQFITPQDGDEKQDCETKAAYRWFDQNAARYASLRPIYLGDDLYARQPMCEKVTAAGGDFIFRVKQGSHKTLFSYLDGVTWPTKRVVKKHPHTRSRI